MKLTAAQLSLDGMASPEPKAVLVDGEAPGPVLTEEQELAVARRSEPLLLSAAAGSGKTSVLVERFVRAVREDEVAPGRILAITFTERAAGELRERVRTRLLELGEREAARDTEAAFVGTFHGFCARLLRAHPLLAGLEPEFAILDEGLAGRLRQRAFRAALREFVHEERPQAVDLLAAYGPDRVRAMIEGIHAQLRSRGARLPRLPAAEPMLLDDDTDAAATSVLLDELLVGFTDAYEELKRERGAVDFDDLELCARELLDGRESVRAAWSERFQLLMVDEFQDTNPRQLAILRALDRGNLFTVGDEHQSIYGFRHADVSLFRARRAELAGRGGSLALRRNFRSRPQLLEVVNAVFAERFAEFAPLVPAREEVSPGPESAGEEEPLVELLLTARAGWEQPAGLAGQIAAGLAPAPLWRQAEAHALAQRVAELVHSGSARAGEVVVLLRALGDVEVYERALQLRGLRTLAAVGAFWEHQQVGDLLAYLRALANPLDELALYETLASPLVGISNDGLALLADAARAARKGVWEIACRAELLAGLPDGEQELLTGFCERLREERRGAPRRTISQLIERAIDTNGYREHALGLEWGERRLANVHKLLRFARRFEAEEGRDLRAFLDHIAHLKDAPGAGESYAPVDGVEPDAVRLMSIHAAKGLEFAVVCVADLGRAPNTRMPDLLVDGERIGLQLVRLDGARATPALDFARLSEERRRAEAEEEDRILYVAMTRARERLLLSGAVDFERWPEQRLGATAISWLGPALAGDERVRCVRNVPECAEEALRLDSTFTPAPQCAPSSIQPTGAYTVATLAPSSLDGQQEQRPTASRQQADAIATFSYSSLSELERCGYRFYLERVLGMREDRAAARESGPAGGGGAGLEARARGTLVHRLLESLDLACPSAPSPTQVATVARELGIRTTEDERNEIAALIDGAISSPPLVRIASAKQVRREHPFAFSLGRQQAGGQLITGVLDLLATEADDGLLVIDYKSDRVGADADLEALVERDYAIQRLLYALAVLRDGAASVEVVHWFLQRPHEWVSTRYAAADRGALEERLAQRLERARGDPFAVSAHPHRALCLTCPGRAGLCSWSEEATLREDAIV